MASNKRIALYFFLLGLFIVPNTSCKVKEGCGLEEKYAPDMETTKRGKSDLFSKKQRKKNKKR